MGLGACFRVICAIQLHISEESVPGESNPVPSPLHSITLLSHMEEPGNPVKVKLSAPVPTKETKDWENGLLGLWASELLCIWGRQQ